MRCPYCNSQVQDGAKFCTECGATLNAAAVRQRQQQTAALAANTGVVLGAAARKARLSKAVSEDQLVSPRLYNGILLGVLLWGMLVNVILCYTAGDLVSRMNPVAFLILYVALAFGGIIIAAKSDKPWLSFLGYNMVVVPFGLVISSVVASYTDLGAYGLEIVKYAFLYTTLIAVGMTGAAMAFPRLFSKLGGALLGVLAGLVICELILMLLGVRQEVSDWIAAGLFSLYVGYDVWRSQQFPKTVDNAVDCALDIYLDLANLFIRLLSILSKRDD